MTKITLPFFLSTMALTKAYYSKSIRLLKPDLLWLFLLLFASQQIQSQTGLINDDFSTGSTYNWIPATSGSTGQIENGKYKINFAPPSSGKYRADFRKNGGVTFHAGNYPIIAIKFNKPPRCNYFFDTNLGTYNGVNNNGTKIVTETSNVYYWDLSTGKLGTTTLSTSQPTTLSSFQIKVADIVLTQEEIDANKTYYEVDWVKSFANVDELRAYLNPSGTTNPQFEFSGTFVHPGLLHTTADLARIKDLVDRKVSRPYQSYQLLLANGKASSSYVMKGPYSSLTRDNSITVNGVAGGTVKNNVESDFLAAYYNALMYSINGNEAHALKAIQILDAYSSTTTSIVGTDSELNGLYGFILANAAEIIHSKYPSWAAAKVTQCQNMLQSVFYPVIGNFRPCAHGNWDIICMKALMAIAIFSEDVPTFNKTINYYYYGEGNGSINNYVLTDAGQLQESNRDQPHVMLALGSMAELAEMALKQGVDLYAANNNAILRGYEYTSQYNLGFDVPFQTSYDYCEKNYTDYTPTAISTTGRGQFRAVFEIAYNHYVYRKGLSMPQTMSVLQTMGPEGAPFGADNPGYGSLLFYLNANGDHPFPNVGLIDDNFTTTTDNWKAVTSGSVATSENEQLKITTVLQSSGKLRGDMQKNNTTLHAGNYPILAIKMKKPANCNFILDTNLGTYGNGSNKWTGKVGEEIYYYDLSKTGFGSTPNMLSTVDGTTLTTFQFKVADITSGETSYTVDWVKTVKTVADLIPLDPATGLINDNFTSSSDGWATTTSGASSVSDAGQLRVTLAQQSNGSFRGDIKKTTGARLYPTNYPIVAIKLKKPLIANITFDTNLGAFGNGSNKWTGKVGNDIYYFDLSKTGFGTGTPLSSPTDLSTFQFKIADIKSGETNYQVDWIKTVKTVAELESLIAPAYQTITFASIETKKTGDADFDPAIASSGLKVSYSSSNEAIATIVDGKIHILASGTTVITASQAGDANYYPADNVIQTLTVIKNDQSISFTSLDPKTIDSSDFDAGATSSSGLAINYTSSNENVATIVNGLIHIVGAGATDITASQAGNENYNAATSVIQSLIVNKLFYKDGDLDGYGSSETALFPSNEAPEGYSNNDTDCNDNDASVHEPLLYYVDADRDGFGSTTEAYLCTSTAPEGYVTNHIDCDDNAILYADNDGDGLGAGAPVACGVANNTDCDDTNPNQLTAVIPNVYALNPDTDEKNTIYIGYGPSAINITANPTDGTAPYSYLWNTSASTQTIAVSNSGIYSLIITDAKGCQTTTSITMKTINVQCGNSGDKVMVCHNGQPICVSSNSVQAHLDHGDKLGSCFTTKIESLDKNNTTTATIDEITSETVTIYPNPVSYILNVKVNEIQSEGSLELYNSAGIKVLSQALKSTSEEMYLDKLPSGTYILNIKNGDTITVKNIIKK